jgi:hypothetical protein
MIRRALVIGASIAAMSLLPVSASGQEASAGPAVVTAAPTLWPPADIVFYALPAAVTAIGPGITTVSVEPASTDDLSIGEAIDLALGHCGLWSPLDLDGSLWQPNGGVTPTGGPIAEDDDATIGELINATPGVFVIVADDIAHWTSATGTIIAFERAPGAVSFPLCM